MGSGSPLPQRTISNSREEIFQEAISQRGHTYRKEQGRSSLIHKTWHCENDRNHGLLIIPVAHRPKNHESVQHRIDSIFDVFSVLVMATTTRFAFVDLCNGSRMENDE